DAKLKPGCLRHLARVPHRLPYYFNFGLAHAGDRLDLLPDFHRQRTRDWAVRRREGHLDVDLGSRFHPHLVDQSELVDVHGDLGVIAGPQRFDHFVVQRDLLEPVQGFGRARVHTAPGRGASAGARTRPVLRRARVVHDRLRFVAVHFTFSFKAFSFEKAAALFALTRLET